MRVLIEAHHALMPDGGVLGGAAILINGRRIEAVGRMSEFAGVDVERRFVGDDWLVLPGFVNAHQHGNPDSPAARGVSDQPLECWLVALIGLPPTDPYLDSLRVARQLARAGVTTAVHAHFASVTDAESYDDNLRAILRGYAEVGVRVVLAAEMRDRGLPVYADCDRFLAGLPAGLRERFPGIEGGRLAAEAALEVVAGLRNSIARGDLGDVALALGPPGPPWCSDELLSLVARASEDWNMPVTTHVLETKYERLFGQRTYPEGTLGALRRLGLLNDRLLAAHCVWVDDADREALAVAGASVATNPASNLRLHAGIAPVRALLATGVNVALGTDNMALGGRDEILDELRLLCALQRAPDIEDAGIDTSTAFGLITSSGGRALGRPDIGVLRAGAVADMVVLDLAPLRSQGLAADPLALALALATSKEIALVIAGGRVIVERGVVQPEAKAHAVAGESSLIKSAGQIAALARQHVARWERS